MCSVALKTVFSVTVFLSTESCGTHHAKSNMHRYTTSVSTKPVQCTYKPSLSKLRGYKGTRKISHKITSTIYIGVNIIILRLLHILFDLQAVKFTSK
jgi:hypothetical protein